MRACRHQFTKDTRILSIPALIIRISFFNHESVAHPISRDLPLTLHTNSIVMSFVVNIVGTIVLLYKSDLARGLPVTVDGESAVFIGTATLNLIVENIKVIKSHLVLSAILVILSFPGLVRTRHEERSAVLFESPCSADLLVC